MKRWQLWVGFGVSLFFLYWAFGQVSSLGEVMEALRRANYAYLVPALGIYFLGVWFRAVRWHYLLAPVKRIPFGRLFPIVVIGYMANDVLPARMGELVRAYVMGEKELVSRTSSLTTIAIERIFDGMTLLFLAAAVSFFVPFGQGLQDIVKLGSAAFLGALALVLLLALWPPLMAAILDVVLKFLPIKVRPEVERMATSFVDGLQVMRQARLVILAVVFSALAWLSEAAMYYLIAVGFGLGQPFYVLLLTTVVANLGTLVPSSPGYIGTFEALAVFTLGLFGVGADLAMSYTIVLHVALLVPVTLLGFGYLWQHHISLSAIGRAGALGSALSKENRG
ncbi:MAG: flippase-like domain-containing protein [Chloroflexi bacterium]|nr:flippase-like domain-containing protein [Chloroflexota bacterium]